MRTPRFGRKGRPGRSRDVRCVSATGSSGAAAPRARDRRTRARADDRGDRRRCGRGAGYCRAPADHRGEAARPDDGTGESAAEVSSARLARDRESDAQGPVRRRARLQGDIAEARVACRVSRIAQRADPVQVFVERGYRAIRFEGRTSGSPSGLGSSIRRAPRDLQGPRDPKAFRAHKGSRDQPGRRVRGARRVL